MVSRSHVSSIRMPAELLSMSLVAPDAEQPPLLEYYARPPSVKLPCPRAPLASRSCDIDPDGDLILEVGETDCIDPDDEDHGHEVACTFRVCSRTLARASVVWKRMLYGGFAESKRPKRADWIIALPEDNAKAMETLLSIIHTRFEGLPRLGEAIELEELYELTVLTDKYDLTHVLRPWAKAWIQAKSVQWPNPEDSLPAEQQLWVAWELGDLQLFERAATNLVLHAPAREFFYLTLGPPGMAEFIRDTRLNTIESFVGPFRTAIDQLIRGRRADGRESLCNSNQDRCEAIMLGSLIRALSVKDLWPLPQVAELEMSVQDLVNIIASISYLSLDYHTNCRPVKRSNEAMKEILRNFKVLATASQTFHLEKQSKRSGLAD